MFATPPTACMRTLANSQQTNTHLNLFVVELGIHQGVSDRSGGVPPVDPPDLALPLVAEFFQLLLVFFVAKERFNLKRCIEVLDIKNNYL